MAAPPFQNREFTLFSNFFGGTPGISKQGVYAFYEYEFTRSGWCSDRHGFIESQGFSLLNTIWVVAGIALVAILSREFLK
jgi:hypothetical protein